MGRGRGEGDGMVFGDGIGGFPSLAWSCKSCVSFNLRDLHCDRMIYRLRYDLAMTKQ